MGSTPRDAAHALGSFYSLSLDALTGVFRGPFQWREFTNQFWFVARVSLVPTILMSIPFTVLVVFTLNSLLVEIGASDMSGAGAGLGAVTQIGPLVTVLVVAGAGATAIAANLGSRTIREEIAALEVLGIDPVARLVVPPGTHQDSIAVRSIGREVTLGTVRRRIVGVLDTDLASPIFGAIIPMDFARNAASPRSQLLLRTQRVEDVAAEGNRREFEIRLSEPALLHP